MIQNKPVKFQNFAARFGNIFNEILKYVKDIRGWILLLVISINNVFPTFKNRVASRLPTH